MPLRFIGASGGTAADAIAAINYAAAFVDAGGKIVRITNNSWAGLKSKSLEKAIAGCGALFVAAAGNNGDSTKQYPAAYTLNNIVSVAATDHNDGLASFSSRGVDWVDLGAPGVDILSTTGNSTYGLNGGTSMAAPHVAGTAALVMAQLAGISVLDTKAQILANVDPVPVLAGLTVTGGRLNARRAVNASELPPDGVAPDTVADLAVASVTEDSATLTWTAPGDDGMVDSAYLYDVRYSTTGPVTDANWSTSTLATGEPVPSIAGSAELFTVEGLLPSRTYYFAVRTMDEVGNASATSNSVVGTTDNNGWIIYAPESANGIYTSHAYDPLGRPVLAYTDYDPNWRTRFAVLDGSTWAIETVANGALSGVSLGFADDGTPTISHANSDLKVSEKIGSSWITTTIDSAAPNLHTWLEFQGTRASISYRQGNTLKLATRMGNHGSSWTTEVVDSRAAARFNALAFDGAGNPAIAYSHDQNGDGTYDRLKVARWTGSSWNIQTIESGVDRGWFCSIAIDPLIGEPAVAHAAAGEIHFWRYDGSAWILEIPDDDPNSSTMTALAYGPDGTCWLSFLSFSGVGMKVARRDPVDGTWTVEVVDPAHNVGALSALRVDSSNLPSLGYGAKLARKLAP
jgi:hypothetical protein